jgi:tRNA(Ile)-lysidine synthase
MLEQKFEEKLKELLPTDTETLVVAVSGGADSLALCLLAKYYAAKNNLNLYTATVDHNLRNDSKAEAAYTNKLLSGLKISHQTFIWQHEPNVKRLHENARSARYQLLTDYAKQFKNSALLTAHHSHDQAETVLMRLFKGSGLKGLTGIHSLSIMNGTNIIRPLLEEDPESLRTYLKEKNIQWLEDSSNSNTRFERTRIRNLLTFIKSEGFAIDGINKSAEKLKTSFDSLNNFTKEFAKEFLLSKEPLTINQITFFESPTFIQMEWLKNTLLEMGTYPYPKPKETIESVLKILKAPKVNDYKICGCVIGVAKKIITITPSPLK